MASAVGRWTRTLGSNRSALGRFTRPAAAADATATIAATSSATSQLRTGMTLVDNNLMFAGATSQKALARTNLNGTQHDLGFFVDSFGHGETMAGWDGSSPMPEPDLTLVDADLNTNYVALGSPRLHAFLWRLPWQLTGSYNPSDGTITPNTSADYNNENRRPLPERMADITLWARKIAYHLISDWGVLLYHAGSEMKGHQSFTTPQTWDVAAFFLFCEALRAGIHRGAVDAGLSADDVTLIVPYPVVAHQGVSDADSVTFDSRNDSAGNPVDYSLLNNDNATYGGIGYVNKAPLQAIDEFLMLWQAAGYELPLFGVDFGTFNNDNIPSPGISDFDLAYRRAKQHLQWYKQRLAARGFPNAKIILDEWYGKAQLPMDDASNYPAAYIEEGLRDDYQAGVQFAFLLACLEEGVHVPMSWSWSGRGLQSTPIGGSDPNQWYGGMVVRTVTNNNDHSGSVVANGGEALSYLEVVRALHDHFVEGTALYDMTFSSPDWRGKASATKAVVVNESGSARTLSLEGGAPLAFAPYQFRLVNV